MAKIIYIWSYFLTERILSGGSHLKWQPLTLAIASPMSVFFYCSKYQWWRFLNFRDRSGYYLCPWVNQGYCKPVLVTSFPFEQVEFSKVFWMELLENLCFPNVDVVPWDAVSYYGWKVGQHAKDGCTEGGKNSLNLLDKIV